MGNAAWVDDELSGTRTYPRPGAVRDELTAGERVVWEGKPRIGWLVILALPLAVVGFAVAVVSWICLVESRGGAAIVAFPALLAGLGVMAAPIWYAWRGLGTVYVITNRRAIVLEPLLIPGAAVRSYAPAALARVVRNQRGDGSGDLIFDEPRRLRGRGVRFVRQGFFAVADVRRVETLLRDTLISPRPGR